MVVVDTSGIVTMMSEEYAKFNGTTVSDAIGRHVTEVIENTRMHIVAQTGVLEMGEAQTDLPLLKKQLRYLKSKGYLEFGFKYVGM